MNPLLFELQELDNQVAQLKRERGHLDDGSTARAQRDSLQQAVQAEQQKAKEIGTRRGKKEDQLKDTEEKLARQQQRLMNAKSAHEVNSLQKDIEGLTRARGTLDEEVLVLMEEGEASDASLKNLQQDLQEKLATLATVEKDFARESSRLDAALAEAAARRSQLATQIGEEDMETYSDFARRRHGVALAHVEKGACSVCGAVLTPFNLRAAREAEWPTCENCGRLIFVAPVARADAPEA